MAEPKWCWRLLLRVPSSGMFHTDAVVQGSINVLPVDIYLPGCPPLPGDAAHAILKLPPRFKIRSGVNREEAIRRGRKAALSYPDD